MHNFTSSEHIKQSFSPIDTRPLSLRIVALGGGTGLPVVLRSLKRFLFPGASISFSRHDRERLTAIVTVTDNGGSSGRLRQDFEMPPPGDIRNCLAALSDNILMPESLFQYYFNKGEGLAGHNLGNLFLAALTDLKGNFADAVICCSRMMNIRGQIVPSTSTNVHLKAIFSNGDIVKGETEITSRKERIQQISITPSFPEPMPLAIEAVQKADVIILGPGSLYTSLIPNLLIKDMAKAIKHSKARKIYICNIMTEPGETDGYTATDHIKAIFDHSEIGLFDYIVLNNKQVSDPLQKIYTEKDSLQVEYNIEELSQFGLKSFTADLLSEKEGWIRHSEQKIGMLLKDIL